ncbi:site-specific integrase [Clostridium algoriphilum]|uniref:tyrosine-type recombinase/integrase n=1 Tax=Clostridium algoriphilum TaxID=198347 RepID=UPI001CF11C76|nr:tyrosine-type recombinase/integrase [Clostridium algoriphilum]MCB2294682.1 site-specific integrase [Clostridium algoriphilum]
MKGGVRQRGLTWSYYFDLGMVDGKRKKKEKGGFRTKGEAEKALRIAMTEYDNAGSVIDESNITVSDYFDYWFKEYVLINCKHHTQSGYRIIIDKHIKTSLGVYKLKSLNPTTLQQFLNSKYKNGYTRGSVANFYGVLSGALKAAVYPYQLLKDNPMTYVSMPKYDNTPKGKNDLKMITLDQFNQIINRFNKTTSYYIPLQIAFNTGMRSSEVCGLTWDCVDLVNKTIRVEKIIISKGKGVFEFGTPKTKSSYRTISIGDTLINILKSNIIRQKENKLKYGEFYTKNDFVCTQANGGLVSNDSLKYISRVVNNELGIKYNFHSLRHTHATILLEGGAVPKDIQERLGHSKIATTMDTYSHVTLKMKNDTVNILENIFATQK